MSFEPFTVASWNIQKTGETYKGKDDDPYKKLNVGTFINLCCDFLSIDIIFLCEIHSGQSKNFKSFLSKAYEGYTTTSYRGGYSNGYILLIKDSIKIDKQIDITTKKLKEINRSIIYVKIDDFFLALAHFKSGQTDKTEKQITTAIHFLTTEVAKENCNYWAITGDMNWDIYKDFETPLPMTLNRYAYWNDMTQRSGNILDWLLAGEGLIVYPLYKDFLKEEYPELIKMKAPDHRPIIFLIAPKTLTEATRPSRMRSRSKDSMTEQPKRRKSC